MPDSRLLDAPFSSLPSCRQLDFPGQSRVRPGWAPSAQPGPLAAPALGAHGAQEVGPRSGCHPSQARSCWILGPGGLLQHKRDRSSLLSPAFPVLLQPGWRIQSWVVGGQIWPRRQRPSFHPRPVTRAPGGERASTLPEEPAGSQRWDPHWDGKECHALTAGDAGGGTAVQAAQPGTPA